MDKVVMGGDLAGVQIACSVQTGYRFLEAACFPQRVTEESVGFAALRIERNGVPQCRLGLSALVLLQQYLNPVERTERPVRWGGHCAAEIRQGLRAIPLSMQEISEPAIGLGEIRRESE